MSRAHAITHVNTADDISVLFHQKLNFGSEKTQKKILTQKINFYKDSVRMERAWGLMP